MSMKLFHDIIKSRNGHYCHALELNDVYAYECVIESIISEFGDKYTEEDYIDFFNTIELYYLPLDGEEEIPEDETALYAFSPYDYIKDTL